LKILYQLLKIIMRLSLRLFYPHIRIHGADRLSLHGPTLLVSNHPNTLMDALIIASLVNRQVYFLANAGMFRYRFTRWFFSKTWSIPIKRSTDDTGKQVINNEDSFAMCYQHLAGGGNLFIAVEGRSMQLRRLHPLRTGAARIALETEKQHDYRLGIHILPIGLNYQRPRRSGAGLVVEAGQPLRVSDWRHWYEKDPRDAVRSLTGVLEAQLEQLVYLHAEDDEQDVMLYRLENMLQSQQPLALEPYLLRSRKLLGQLQQLRQQSPDRYQQLEEALEAYNKLRKETRQHDLGIAYNDHPIPWLLLLSGFIPWLWSWLNHLIAYQLPRLAWRYSGLYPTYAATFKFSVGLVLTFPLGYGLQYYLCSRWLPAPWPWVYLLSLPVLAVLGYKYASFARPYCYAWRFRRWQRTAPEAARSLLRLRQTILAHTRL
jgi:glycerol-3-phosphate O-acyltransferase/dihydroxyacetone phosphate acyltransferase